MVPLRAGPADRDPSLFSCPGVLHPKCWDTDLLTGCHQHVEHFSGCQEENGKRFEVSAKAIIVMTVMETKNDGILKDVLRT